MDLNINFDETRGIGQQIMAKAESFSSLVSRVNSINNEVGQVWTGTDAAKYVGGVSAQIQNMMQLAETIQIIESYLVKVSNAYEQAAENNANAVRG